MSSRKRALILINETAGTGTAGQQAMMIARKAAENGYEPVIYPIVPDTELTSESLVADYDGKADLVLCSGGDGTLHHVMNAVMRLKERPCLAYLPAGSANDFAKGLRIPSDKKKAVETAFCGGPFPYDIGSMNDRYFNYVAAFGAFADVSYATTQEMKNILGYAAYVINAAGELFQSLSYSRHMIIETEQGSEEGDYIFGAVCNSVSIGGLSIFQKAGVKLDDGKMELLLIKAPKNILELNAIVTALTRGITDDPNISFRQIEYARFSSEEDVAWALDGEFGGEGTLAEIRVHKHALRIMSGEVKVENV